MDLLQQLEQLDAPPLVAPWDYTDDAHSLHELDRSLDAWLKAGGPRRGAYQGWSRGYANQRGPGDHNYTATTAHKPNPDAPRGSLYVHRAYCDCGWVGPIGSERESVAAWHDHAWPGWRDLPVLGDVPGDRGFNKRSMDRYRATAMSVQPAAFQVEFAPVISRREPPGSRDVPGYSPFGGFDICHLTLAVKAITGEGAL